MSFRYINPIMLTGVRHLVGEPDYRAVKLRWEAFPRTGGARAMPPFQVSYLFFIKSHSKILTIII